MGKTMCIKREGGWSAEPSGFANLEQFLFIQPYRMIIMGLDNVHNTRGRRRTNDTAPELDRTPTNPRLSCNRLNQAEASIMKEALPPTLEHGG
jgi:hypothetical protein